MPKRSKPVTWSPELDRVVNLPTRDIDWTAAAQAANAYSRALLNPKGLAVLQRLDLLSPDARAAEMDRFVRETGCPIELSAEQVVMLSEWSTYRGFLALAGVGIGKTLTFYLAALIAERLWGVTRTAIYVPAYLYDDTIDAHDIYRQYWQSHVNTPRIVTYDELSQEKNAHMLCDCKLCTKEELPHDRTPSIKPQVNLLDEADLLRHVDSARTARIARYLKNHLGETRNAAATGSLIQDSVREAIHLMVWTLKERTPFALTYPEQKSWCAAVDPTESREGRADPSMLIDALSGRGIAAADEYEQARKTIGQLWKRTPGFVIISKSSCDEPIHVRVFSAPDDPVIEQAFWDYRASGYQTLDGWIIGDSLSRGAYERALGCGYYDYWDPRPPIEWLRARNEYNEAVRDVIEYYCRRGKPIETEKQARRKLQDSQALANWLAVQKEFEPNPKSASVSPSVINWIAKWLELNSPGIVWVNGTWLGETLEQVTGVPYYAAEGKSKAGKTPKPGQSIIASTKSNMRGRNWQAWGRMLVPSIPGSSSWQEQMIGRSHRQGRKGAIHVDYLISSGVTLNAISAAFRRSSGTKDLFGLTPKILTTAWDWGNIDPRVLNVPEKPLTGFDARWRSNAVLGEKDK